MSRLLLQQALGDLKLHLTHHEHGYVYLNSVMCAIEAEVAKPEPTPVAWMWKDGTVTTDPDRADGTWTKLYALDEVTK